MQNFWHLFVVYQKNQLFGLFLEQLCKMIVEKFNKKNMLYVQDYRAQGVNNISSYVLNTR